MSYFAEHNEPSTYWHNFLLTPLFWVCIIILFFNPHIENALVKWNTCFSSWNLFLWCSLSLVRIDNRCSALGWMIKRKFSQHFYQLFLHIMVCCKQRSLTKTGINTNLIIYKMFWHWPFSKTNSRAFDRHWILTGFTVLRMNSLMCSGFKP